MSLLKTTLMTAALVLGGTHIAFAQDSMTDKAKEMAIDEGTKMAKDKAIDAVGEDNSKYVDPAAKMGKNMLKGDSAKDAAMKAVTSDAKSMGKTAVMGGSAGGLTDSSLTTDEAVTAGKVMIKGGSKEDAAMAIAKDRAEGHLMGKAKGMMTAKTVANSPDAATDMSSEMMTAPVAAPAPITTTVINCPSGTTAQPDGSCMITGDYKG